MTRLAGALAALGLAACASTPTGDWDMAVVSQAQLERYSARFAASIDNQWVFADRALTEYLDELGTRLVAHSAEPERAFQFKVLKSDSPNLAFSLPGGQIYVARGLLALASSDDAVAMVLGHEIGHVTARHSRSQTSKAELIHLVTSIVTAPLFDPTQTIANAMPGLITPGFSRSEEREADDLGLKMVRDAGLDPACAARMLQVFHDVKEAAGLPETGGGFFDTHPEAADRYERLVEADSLATAPRCSRAYDARVVGLRLDPDDGIYSDAAGDLVLPSIAIRVAGGVAAKLETTFPLPFKAELKDPRTGVWLRVEPARDPARATEVALCDESHKKRACVYHRWLESGGTVYLLTSQFPRGDRDDWEPVLEALGDRIHAIPPDELAVLPIVQRVALHTVAPGETLESIATQYGVWSAPLLAVYNDRPPDAPLEVGEQLKVAQRQPLGR